jgi:O-methyltransferase
VVTGRTAAGLAGRPAAAGPEACYLDLLKRCLVNTIYQDRPIHPSGEPAEFDLAARLAGQDHPGEAHTMIGLGRLDSLQELAEDVITRGVPGDFVEAGVGRGGAVIFMRGVLRAHGVADRVVWAADSFGEFPRSREAGITRRSYTSAYWDEMTRLARREPAGFQEFLAQVAAGNSYAEVRDHFDRYGLLDGQVRFLRGWFCDTLPAAGIKSIALLRVDGDLYDSTYQALRGLYPRLAPGGYVVIDDYHTFTECQEAVTDYLDEAGICPGLTDVDEACVYWRRPAQADAEGAVVPAPELTRADSKD